MKHVTVNFNTKERTFERALEELRRRYRKSEGFRKLLAAAADAQLRGWGATLKGSNPHATRALEHAVRGVRRTLEIDSKGHAARSVYLMKQGRVWGEVSKATALAAMRESTLDSLAVMPVWVYDSSISHRAARKLEALTAPEDVELDDIIDEFIDTRETNSPHFTDDSGYYNDAGELVKVEKREPRETFEDAWRPLPRKAKVPERVPTQKKELPAAPWYHATVEDMPKEVQEVYRAEEERRRALEHDAEEVDAMHDIDTYLSSEDLEATMLEDWEALERFASN